MGDEFEVGTESFAHEAFNVGAVQYGADGDFHAAILVGRERFGKSVCRRRGEATGGASAAITVVTCITSEIIHGRRSSVLALALSRREC
ncbi:hypothetical protein GCM10027447_38230 [Glycomyces halotolerans]